MDINPSRAAGLDPLNNTAAGRRKPAAQAVAAKPKQQPGGAPIGAYGKVGAGPSLPQAPNVRQLTDKEIMEQTKALLNEYYKADPAAAEQVKQGQVPDYWGVQQTGQRMFDLLVSAFGEEGGESFAAKAKALLEQAYGDAERIFGGGLPDLVLRTRDALFAAIDKVAGGATLADARAGIGVS